MSEVFRNYIDGNWVESASGETFTRLNPATGELVATYTKSTTADVDAAVTAAAKAFKSWRLYPAPKRGELLYKAAALLQERKEQFAREMTEEMGKVISEARGDVQEAIDMTFYMAGEGRRLYGQTTPSELQNKFNMSVRKPIGVCGIITPWNFPMAIPSWKITPAIVSGNTVVFKPASLPRAWPCGFVEVLEEAGLPAGVVNLVIGGGADVGNAIVEHPDVPLCLVHRLDRDRHRCRHRGRPPQQARLARNGRQKRGHRDGRCRPRSRDRWHSLERLRHLRASAAPRPAG